MPSIILDFDSTLISVESLEKILAEKRHDRRQVIAEIEAITTKGMAGSCSFSDSLSQRLALAAPNLAEVEAFGNQAKAWLTPGMGALIHGLQARGVAIHIVSGGLIEAIWPVAAALKIPKTAVHAVRLIWSSHGEFLAIDANDPFSQSKLAGFKTIYADLARPIIVVGDGMTDFELYRAGLADHFVAFCQNVQREAVVAVAKVKVADVGELSRELEQWL